jgi:hypothetical protein
MLTPISRHESQPHKRKWNQENKNRRTRVDIFVKEEQESIVAQLTASRLESHLWLSSAQKVARQIEPDQEVESTNVSRKIPNIVSLIADS